MFLIFFSHFFYLKNVIPSSLLDFKKKKTLYLIVNNEYKSMVFTILRGCLPYSNSNARMVHTMLTCIENSPHKPNTNTTYT